MMDWFERLTGFREASYKATQRQLQVEGGYLRSKFCSRAYRIGILELPSLGELRERVSERSRPGQLAFSSVQGDVRDLHRARKNAGALFQVASQFNLLEMVGPEVAPEGGVTRYACDRTQGPACAISAGAATLYRNYFVPVGDQTGQTADCQLDTLADLRRMLARELGIAEGELWTLKNGYPIARPKGIQAVGEWIEHATEDQRDSLRREIRIGVHWNVEVTDEPEVAGSLVSQAFCSAIPVSYSTLSPRVWEPLARLVLEAAYEATFCAAALNTANGNSKKLYLTRLGGGAFGNPPQWIEAALARSVRLFARHELEAQLVQYGLSR